MSLRLNSPLLSIALLLFAADQAIADCDPLDFATITDIQQTPETELAFVLTAPQQQYDRIKSEASTGAYGLFGEKMSYQDARTKARSIAQATRFDSASSYAAIYLSQHISPKGYSACLQNDRETAGLRLWLARREGDFLLLSALWIGSDPALGTASYDADPVVEGGTIVSKPRTWAKAQVQEIAVKRSGNVDVFLNLRVGGQSRTLVIVKDPPAVFWKTSTVFSQTLMKTSTAPRNPGCGSGQVSDCISPARPGGTFVPGSRAVTDRSTNIPNAYSETFTVDRPDQVCVTVTQSTGACEVQGFAQGRLMAIEKYPDFAQ
jgi:hypothetical protein